MCQLQGFFEEYGGKLKPGAVTVYFALNAEAEKWGTNSFFLSDKELTKMTGISRRTIPKHLEELESIGLVKYERYHGRRLATGYVVRPLNSFQKVEKFASFSTEKREEISRFNREKREKAVKKREEISHHHDHDYENDHDELIKRLHSLGMNGDGEKYVSLLGVERSQELLEIALERADNPGAYFRVLADKELNSRSVPRQQDRPQREEDEDEFIKFWKRRWEWVLAQNKNSKTTTEKVDVHSRLRDLIEQIKRGS